jgi:N-acetylmuramoyl-L-alanine amidase
MARTIERIVWHTAAHGRDGQAFDTTAAQIDQWHRERGWSEIGYNVVIRFSGAIEHGRDPRKIPQASQASTRPPTTSASLGTATSPR